MGWLNIALQVAPLVTKLVVMAEEMAKGQPKSGADKKQFVHQSVMTILKGAEEVTTGGAHETATALEKFLPDTIDSIAGCIFGAGVNK